MIYTAQPLTQKQFLPGKKFNFEQKRQKSQLVARWHKVDGKLVCQWVTK